MRRRAWLVTLSLAYRGGRVAALCTGFLSRKRQEVVQEAPGGCGGSGWVTRPSDRRRRNDWFGETLIQNAQWSHNPYVSFSKHFYRPHTECDRTVMFLLCVSVHRGRAPQVKVRSRSGGTIQVKVWGPPGQGPGLGGPPGQGQGQGLGNPQLKVQVKVRAPQVKVLKGRGAGGMPLSVTQKDCLVSFLLWKNFLKY